MDVFTTRLAIVFLGLICLLCITGVVYAETTGRASVALYAFLGPLAGNCSGAIVGIIVPTRISNQPSP